MQNLKILFICDDNLADSVVYDIHLLAESLSLRGHKVTIVGSSRGSKICLKSKYSLMQRVSRNSTAEFYQFPYFKVPGLNWIFGIIASGRLIRRLVHQDSIDVIIMYSVLFTGLPTLKIAKSMGIPAIFRNIDLLHKLQPNLSKQILVRLLERYIYKRVDRTLSLTEEYRSYVLSLNSSLQNVKVLPFPVDSLFFSVPEISKDFRANWGIFESDFIAVYMGHLYSFSMLEDIIRAIPKLLIQIPNFKLLIIGAGPLFDNLNKLKIEMNLDKHVVLTGKQEFDLMPKFLKISDVCINSYTLHDEMINLFSAKVIQYMAAGKPVISMNQLGLATSLGGDKSGVIFVDSLGELIDSIIDLFYKPERRKLLATLNKKFACENYDINIITKSLEEELYATCSINRISCKK